MTDVKGMHRRSVALLGALALAAALVAAVLPAPSASAQPVETLSATIAPVAPGTATGAVAITAGPEDGDPVTVDMELTGLDAETFHAVHVIDGVDCTTDPNPELVDGNFRLGVVRSNAAGEARHQFLTSAFALADVENFTVVVRALPDNFANIPDRYSVGGDTGPDDETLATGDAGAPIGCGPLNEDTAPNALPAGDEARGAVLVNAAGGMTGLVNFTAVDTDGDDTADAVLVEADITGLTPGWHGFHVHAGPTCTGEDGRPDFTAAGGHWNGADHGGHIGDMPSLFVNEDGRAELAFITDQFDLEGLTGRAVMVHEGTDNFANIPDRYQSSDSDDPGPDAATLGAGDAGPRAACGVLDGTALRLAGPAPSNRLTTAVAISQSYFADDAAQAAVLARADVFADGLAGTPLATAKGGPLLLSGTDALPDVTAEELQRVLPDGATVYLLGGEQALSAAVEEAVADLGFETERVGGSTRIETSVAIAREIGDPDALLITTGYRFPDALAAGAAAGHAGGAVLLTIGEQRHPSVDAYLEENDDAEVYAVGGPAARPYDEATAVVGSGRRETAVAVANEFFDSPDVVGLARQGGVGDDTDTAFADALTGGAHAAANNGPILLTQTEELAPVVQGYVLANADSIFVGYLYGGTAALSADVHAQLQDALDGAVESDS